MSGFPFPTSTHKWQGMSEAKHPLVRDLIKLWEESPGYILPQGSFISDRTKLEALIDSVIEMQKQKANMPVRSVAPKAVESENKNPDDPDWEKKLVRALSSTAVATKKVELSKVPALAGMPPLPGVPNLPTVKSGGPALPAAAEERFAKLKMAEPAPLIVPQTVAPPQNITKHLMVLYALCASAFIIACYSLFARN